MINNVEQILLLISGKMIGHSPTATPHLPKHKSHWSACTWAAQISDKHGRLHLLRAPLLIFGENSTVNC